MRTDFAPFHSRVVSEVETALEKLLPPAEAAPARLHEAMRYSVFAGGKRIRPLLVVLGGEAYGGSREALIYGAAAVELVHTFSLIHDDLPALDDDDLRRGQPTLHRQFDEATAVLAGDALLTLALELLASGPEELDPDRRSKAATMLAQAVGSRGMIGGQMADLEAEARWPEDAEGMIEFIHRGKTGRLITAALRLGGLYAAVDQAADAGLRELGESIGLIFQISDDLLDVEGSSEALGKAARKDAAARKLTYPALFGLEGTRARLAAERDRALSLAEVLPARGPLMRDLVEFIAKRDH